MAKLTKDDILRQAERDRVHFVRLQFTDILGIVKNVSIPASRLEEALSDRIMFDGSSIEGFTRIEESDMNLRPDYQTFAAFPWRSDAHGRVARLVCDVYKPSGEPFLGDPRLALKRVLQKVRERGLLVEAGFECEFFLFRRDAEGRPSTLAHDDAGYFDLGPLDRGEDARRDIVVALEEMGYEVDGSHHEVAPGQHEIDLKMSDALTMADFAATFKVVTRAIAARYGLHATFMPKPLFGVNGSGMHTHLKLMHTDGRNAFFDADRPYQLSSTALQFIGGVLEHAPALTALTNPLVNSYKRLMPGYEAPTYISWSAQNRSALVRVPTARQSDTRIELRSPDPSCNPYLALAAIVQAGLDGIERQTVPPPSVDRNVAAMPADERSAAGIASLPRNLDAAVSALEESECILSALGPHIAPRYIEAKHIEWDVYRAQVHPWEIEQYLTVF